MPDLSTDNGPSPQPEEVQFCTYCSEPFPIGDPMVDYDGNDYCSPNCVRESLANEDPCDHAQYVASVVRFHATLGRILGDDGKAGDERG